MVVQGKGSSLRVGFEFSHWVSKLCWQSPKFLPRLTVAIVITFGMMRPNAFYCITATTQKMKELILSKNLPFGDTQAGRDWCIKALHPADPLTTLDGIPDECSSSVVNQSYSQTFTVVNPLPNNAGDWHCDVFFYPHPVICGAVHVIDAVGTSTWYPMYNSQIPGATISAKMSYVRETSERYRLSYLGVTGYLNAPATQNSGLCTAAQYMETPLLTGITWSTASQVLAPNPPIRNPHSVPVTDAPVPTGMIKLGEGWYETERTFEQLQNMPNCYVGAAREGVYVPYRLSSTHQKWRSSSNFYIHIARLESAVLDGQPYAATTDLQGVASGPYGIVGTTSTAFGNQVLERADTGVIHISYRNLNSAGSLMFYFRAGYEYQVLPGTSLASFQRTSPSYDPTAIKTYFAISRELKDAYPADYNDLGKILGTIWDVAKGIAGTVFPPARIPIAAIDAVRSAVKPREPSSQMGSTEPTPDLVSAATKERMQQQVVPRPIRLKPAKKKIVLRK